MLPVGVEVHELVPHEDERGVLVELFREQWGTGCQPVQWNAVRSSAGVLRGVHLHLTHTDYLTVCAGRMALGLHDLRPGSTTEGESALVDMAAERPIAVVIPVGVAHGFYFLEPSITVYAVSHYWDPADELGCRWDDPGLGIAWPCATARLSERDEHLGSLSELRAASHAALSGPAR